MINNQKPVVLFFCCLMILLAGCANVNKNPTNNRVYGNNSTSYNHINHHHSSQGFSKKRFSGQNFSNSKKVRVVFGAPQHSYKKLGTIKYKSKQLQYSSTLKKIVKHSIPFLKKKAKKMGGNAIYLMKRKIQNRHMFIYALVLNVKWNENPYKKLQNQ